MGKYRHLSPTYRGRDILFMLDEFYEDADDYIASLYERANALADDQAEETVKSLTPQDEDWQFIKNVV